MSLEAAEAAHSNTSHVTINPGGGSAREGGLMNSNTSHVTINP